jgi:hypothetical protein
MSKNDTEKQKTDLTSSSKEKEDKWFESTQS